MKDWDTPLDKLIAQITAQRDGMQKELDEMEGALKEKKRLADERATLELMLETHNVVAKVERLLHEVGAGPAGKESAADPETPVVDTLGVADVLGDDDDSDDDDVPEAIRRRGRRGRLGRAQTRLRDRPGVVRPRRRRPRAGAGARGVGDGPTPVPAKQGEEAAVRAVPRAEDRRVRGFPRRRRRERLAGGGAGAPAPRDRSRIEHCLRAHVAMDRTKDAEEAIGRVLVEPAVRRVVDSATAATSFPELLHACVAAAIASCELEVEASGDREFGMDAKMCVLANSVLAKVDEAVHAARPGEYGPGEPDRFIRNQKAAMAAIWGWRSERRPWRT